MHISLKKQTSLNILPNAKLIVKAPRVGEWGTTFKKGRNETHRNKFPGLLGKMADSRIRAGNTEDAPGTSCNARN